MQVHLQLYTIKYLKAILKLFSEDEKYMLLSIVLVAIVFAAFIIAFMAVNRHFQKVKRKKIEEEKWDMHMQSKVKKLKTHALQLANRNELLQDIQDQVAELKNEYHADKRRQRIINQIKKGINNDTNWSLFSAYFNEVYVDFSEKVRRSYPEISDHELRLMVLIRMNLSSKTIGSILNISHEGVKKARYRLRKKNEARNRRFFRK